MEDETKAFSSATFLERDKAIKRKHEDEIRSYKVVLDKMNHVNAELRASLFDLKNRSNRLVQNLGFGDLTEAQMFIDTEKLESRQIDYRRYLKLVGNFEDDLKEAKTLIAQMENRERELEEECTALRKANVESTSAYRQLVQKHQNLQAKHDDTIKANKAAQERRRRDYEKWKRFKRWILCAAELEQFQQYEKEFGFEKMNKGDRAMELFRIVKGKKYQLSQLNSLEDRILFDLVEQNLNDSRLFLTPASVMRCPDDGVNSSLITPFSPSSLANKPSPSPFTDANTTMIPPQLLLRSFAIKNSSNSLPNASEPARDSGLPTLNNIPAIGEEGRSVEESVTASTVSALANAESPSRQSTANSASFQSGERMPMLASDSETEDESQSLRWSQFQPQAIIAAPTVDHSRTPTQSSSIIEPSMIRSESAKSMPTFNATACSRSIVTSSPSNNVLNSPSPPQQCQEQISAPSVSSSHGNAIATVSNSSTKTKRFPYAEHYPLSPTPMSRVRRKATPHAESQKVVGLGRSDELPPKKYRKSIEGRRIPSDDITKDALIGIGKNDDRSRRMSAPSALLVEEENAMRANPQSSNARNSLPVSFSPYKQIRSRPKGKEKQKDNDNYKENDSTVIISNGAHRSHSRRQESIDDRPMFGLDKRKRKEKDIASASKPTPKGPLEDYSMYKGRGRYGQNKNQGEEDTAINEMFEIDPAQNAGIPYPYDEVVRGKEKRKQLIGGDCDDCREYYEAVGPMPPRLQPPLWKSPVKGNHHARPSPKSCPHHLTGGTGRKRNQDSHIGGDEFIFHDFDSPSSGKYNRMSRGIGNPRNSSSTEISTHKQNISRHRAAWARGNTPPAYWDIGFPDTQMAEEINEKAREMRMRKKEMVEQEAAKEGGRYRRK